MKNQLLFLGLLFYTFFSNLYSQNSGTSLDQDSNSFEWIKYGDQYWSVVNAEVETYRDGTPIPYIEDQTVWKDLTIGAWCYYENDSTDGKIFGKLYNWYAVDDARGLCPSGWHVPTDGEWMSLEMNLGLSDVEANNTGWRGTDQGSQLKTDFGWYNGGNGLNTSGFSGLPGGIRGSNGSFFVAGSYGYWWSSSPQGTFAWFRNLYTSNANVYRNSNFNRRGGFSVRCVLDAE